MQVIPPAKTQRVGSHIILGSQQEEPSRQEAMGYLNALTRKKKSDTRTWRCDIAVSNSVSDGIVNIAGREKVDLIAMYAHDRRLLARHVKRSIARDVQRKASTEVWVIGTPELPAYIHHEAVTDAETELDTPIFKQVDVFNDLSNEQIDQVVALGQRLRVTAGETLGTGGEPGRNLYVILEGEAHLTTHCEAGEISVRRARPSEAFPLATLLGSGTLIPSGEALSDMEVLAIPRSELLKLCERDKETGMRVYASIGRLFSKRHAETLTHMAIILREAPNVKKVGLVANRRDCVAKIMEREHLTHQEAEKAVIERDKARAYYFKRFFGADDPDHPEFYHLVINTSDVPVDCAVDLVVQSAKALEEGWLRTADAVG